MQRNNGEESAVVMQRCRQVAEAVLMRGNRQLDEDVVKQ